MPSCPRCGVENPAGKAACWNCFAPMSARRDQFRDAAEERAAEAEAPARPMKRVLVGVLVLAVLGAAAWYFIFSKPSPAAIGKKYLEAVKAGDATAQEQYASAAATSRTRSGVGVLKMLSGQRITPKEFTVESTTEGSDVSRTLDAALTYDPPAASAIATLPLAWREPLRSGGTMPVQLTLVAEGGTWKVDDVVPKSITPRMPTSAPPTTGAPGASERETPAEGYIGNVVTRTYHLPSCEKAPQGRTRKVFKTKEEAEDAGFQPCPVCNP